MNMLSLREKVMQGMTEEERCDVLFTLTGMIGDGQPAGGDPDAILIGEDGHVELIESGEMRNPLFWPPEMLSAQQEGETPSEWEEQRWFFLGMLAYFMYYQEDFYAKNNYSLLMDLRGLTVSRTCIISPDEAADIPFGAAVSQLTAVEPRARVKGVKAFLDYLREKMPGTAKIRYCLRTESGPEVLFSETWPWPLNRDIPSLGYRININGGYYHILETPARVPYRPGTHCYDFEVIPESFEVIPEPFDAIPQAEVSAPLMSSSMVGASISSGSSRVLCVPRSVFTRNVDDVNQLLKFLELDEKDSACRVPLPEGSVGCVFHIAFDLKNGEGFRSAASFPLAWKTIPKGSKDHFIHLRYQHQYNLLQAIVTDKNGQPLCKDILHWGDPKTVFLGEHP